MKSTYRGGEEERRRRNLPVITALSRRSLRAKTSNELSWHKKKRKWQKFKIK